MSAETGPATTNSIRMAKIREKPNRIGGAVPRRAAGRPFPEDAAEVLRRKVGIRFGLVTTIDKEPLLSEEPSLPPSSSVARLSGAPEAS